MDDRPTRLLLIVEDDRAAHRALCRIFCARDWDICLSTTVAEALSLLEHGLEPEGAIVDLGLPDGGGEAVLGKIAALGLATRVAICTGLSDPVRLRMVRSYQPDLLLFKPVDPEVLGRACEEWAQLA